MDSLVICLLGAALLFLLFKPTFIFVVILQRFLRGRWRFGEFHFASEEELSEAFVKLASKQLERLEAMGFRKERVLLGDPHQAGAGVREGWILRKAGDAGFAALSWERGGTLAPRTGFYAVGRDDRYLATLMGHPLQEFGPCDRVVVHRLDEDDPERLHQAHERNLQAFGAQGGGLVDVPLEDIPARVGDILRCQLLQLRDEGNLRIDQDGVWQFGRMFCLRLAWRFAWNHRAIARTERHCGLSVAERARLKGIDPAGVNPESQPPSKGKSWNWTLISLAVFALVQGMRLGWTALPTFLGALILHEAGHLVAMRIFGYRDVKVFFVPFLGALATADGKPWGLAPWKRAVVLLAGPLPGLFLGIGLYGSVFLLASVELPLWVQSLRWSAVEMLLLLNLFNLLPLGGLDGGQYCQAVLFSRFPKVEVAFRLAGSLALAALGLWLKTPMLAAFAVLPLLALRSAWDAASLRVALARQARESGMPASREEAILRLDALFEEPGHARIPMARRGLVRETVLQELDVTVMPWWQTLLFLLVYLLLWSPLLVLLATEGAFLLGFFLGPHR